MEPFVRHYFEIRFTEKFVCCTKVVPFSNRIYAVGSDFIFYKATLDFISFATA